MRILLTGGTGFFGKALLRHWNRAVQRGAGHAPKVTVMSRDPKRFMGDYPELCDASWLGFVHGDISQPGSLAKARTALEGTTHVLHAAADSTLGPKLSPIERFDQILEGTRHMLNLSVQLGARRFLLCSSGGVYGPPPAGVTHLSESFLGIPEPLEPNNAYSIAKRAAEHLCSLYAEQHGLDVVIARCFAFVGQDLPLDVHFAVGNFIRDALKRPEIVVAGDGTAVRSYLDQRDLAEWLLVILQRGKAGRAYNVGSDEALSVGELANLVREVLAPQKPVKILGGRGGFVDLRACVAELRNVYVPSIERARTELDLDVRIPLRTAILDAAREVKGRQDA